MIDPLRLPPALRELARRRARRNLLDFTRWTFPEYAANWHHAAICGVLDRWRRGEISRLILCMPPRHGKTELVSRRLPALILGENPDARIIMASHTASLAESNSRDVQRILESERYRHLFSVRLPGKIARTAGRYKRTDAHFEIPARKGYLRAVGVGGSITGFGFDFGIVDDPFRSAEEAESEVIRERVWQWFTRDFWTRRAAGARVLVTMTRWNVDDVVGRILRLGGRGLGEWEVLSFPALATDRCGPQDRRKPGQPLWPQFMDAAELRDIEQADPRGFAALYQQDPQAAGGTEFPADYFGPWLWVPAEEWPSQEERGATVLAVDPSRGREDAASDYAAIVWAAMHRHRDEVFVDGDLEVRTPSQTLDRVLDLFDRLRPDFLAVETNQFQILFAHELERRGREGFKISLPLVYVQNYLPKILRVRRLGPWLAARQLRFADSRGARLIVDQLREFPLGRHDDGPDALEMALRILTEQAPRRVESLTYRPGVRDSLPFDWR